MWATQSSRSTTWREGAGDSKGWVAARMHTMHSQFKQRQHPEGVTHTAEPEVLEVSGGCVKTAVPAALVTVMFCAAMCDRNSGGSWPALEMATWNVCTSPTSCHGHTSAGPPVHANTFASTECTTVPESWVRSRVAIIRVPSHTLLQTGPNLRHDTGAEAHRWHWTAGRLPLAASW